jgi:hypothetical protein
VSFYSPIDRLAQTLPRPKGTGAEFMTELSKMPGYKSQEAEDRGLQALVNMPKMERAQFMEALKSKPPVTPETRMLQTPHHEHYTLPGGENYREFVLRHPQGEFKGVPHHFGGVSNILASVRAKDRTGPNGEKIFHIEELQSDWHQQGREKGYLNPKEEHTEEEKKYGVPNAPFKKNWHEMALKKMIHHAAKNGYDSIAITPGAEQADRYGLAQHIGVLSYDPERQHFAAFKPNRETAMHEHGATPERVSQLVGKELAQKLMASPRQGGFHYLEGDDIKVGGEGMKGFYDKIVPNFLNQFGKKYGAKVQPGTVSIVSTPAQHHGLTESQFQARPLAEQQDMLRQHAYAHQGAKTEVPVHTFPITPAMREDVTKNGVPLYTKGGKVSRETHDANLAKFLSESKVKDRLYHATPKDFSAFKPGGDNPRISGHAIWLGADPSHLPAAHHIGDPKNPKSGVQIMPVHVQIKKPMVLDDKDMLAWAQAAYAGGSKEFPELMPKEWADKVKEDYDSIIHADPHGRGDPHEIIMFDPRKIKSAIGNRGTYDPNDPDITKAKGGSIKPVGYTKERVTVSPNLDAMRYELESVKHYSKKVK